MKPNQGNQLRIVVSGSFRKHFSGIQETILEFEQLEMCVLSPKLSRVVNPGSEFAILESDDIEDPKTLEQRHLDAIEKADALYLYNPGGYIGASATLELGWAQALGKPVFAKEKAEDFTLKLYCDKATTPEEVRDELLKKEAQILETINSRSPIAQLQHYLHKAVHQRGFADESPSDIMLLMVEEVGELAKSLRKYVGLKVDVAKKDKYHLLQHEVADVFIYLLDLANACGIDLFKAFYSKERENQTRAWK